LATEDQLRNLKDFQQRKKVVEKSIRNLKIHAMAQQKSMRNRKAKLAKLKEKYPGIENEIPLSQTAGRPTLEREQPLLLKTIVDIVSPSAAAEDRRRAEVLRACTTIDDLKVELEKKGNDIFALRKAQNEIS
jgi:hypothetical protein